MEETGVPEENHGRTTGHREALLYHVVSSAAHLSGVRTHNLAVDIHWFNR